MWEKLRQDGKKKLKRQAVPTILMRSSSENSSENRGENSSDKSAQINEHSKGSQNLCAFFVDNSESGNQFINSATHSLSSI